MPGSLTYSSKGGAIVSQIPEDFETPHISQQLLTGQQITVLATDPDGEAPTEQCISISSTAPLTLPQNPFTASSPWRKGQVVFILNVGSHSITFPIGSFNPGSRSETLESNQMIQIIFMPPIGWIPCDDDQFSNQLPLTLWSGPDNLPSNARVTFHDKGAVFKKGSHPSVPVALLQTTSFAPGGKVVGANYAIGDDDHTVMLGGAQPAQFTIPNPANYATRELRLVSEFAQINLVVTGGGSVRTGQSTLINSVPAGSALTIQALNGQWRKVV